MGVDAVVYLVGERLSQNFVGFLEEALEREVGNKRRQRVSLEETFKDERVLYNIDVDYTRAWAPYYRRGNWPLILKTIRTLQRHCPEHLVVYSNDLSYGVDPADIKVVTDEYISECTEAWNDMFPDEKIGTDGRTL